MNKFKYNVYDYYDFKQSIGQAQNPLQVKVICEDYIDETDGECLLFVFDTETLREYSYNEFMAEVYGKWKQ